MLLEETLGVAGNDEKERSVRRPRPQPLVHNHEEADDHDDRDGQRALARPEGHTHGEIGKLLDVSPTTSKTQLHRARKLLRKALS